jgi:pimeloyl-ACP methyl ester carboxylesterase
MFIFALTMSAKINIVLMHGWGCDHTIWRGVQNQLEATDKTGGAGGGGGESGKTDSASGEGKYRVTAVDFPGFGQTPEPEKPWGMEDYTAWFEAFLAERGIENPVLIGHSFGGRVALIFASRNPVSKIVLVDAAGVKPRRSARYYIKVWSFKALKRLAPLLLGRAKAAEMIERRRAKAGSADYNAASPVMRGTLSRVVNEDLKRFMPLISAPTLLVWGSEDTATPPKDAKIMERLIPDAGLVTFEGAGHYSFLDRPAQFAAVLDSFLRS